MAVDGCSAGFGSAGGWPRKARAAARGGGKGTARGVVLDDVEEVAVFAGARIGLFARAAWGCKAQIERAALVAVEVADGPVVALPSSVG